MPDVIIKLLLYFILPLWLLAGFADYLCHRASRIALPCRQRRAQRRTAGSRRRAKRMSA